MEARIARQSELAKGRNLDRTADLYCTTTDISGRVSERNGQMKQCAIFVLLVKKKEKKKKVLLPDNAFRVKPRRKFASEKCEPKKSSTFTLEDFFIIDASLAMETFFLQRSC